MNYSMYVKFFFQCIQFSDVLGVCIIKACPLICRIWVRHAVPKFIEIETSTIATKFGIGGWLSIDTCDALIRSFQSVDIHGAGPVWRHFLESDFAVTKSSYSDWIPFFLGIYNLS